MSAVSRLRRLLQFDLRTMLLLVAFCAVLSAWYRDRQRLDNLLTAMQSQREVTARQQTFYWDLGCRLPPPIAGNERIATIDEFIEALRTTPLESQSSNVLVQLSTTSFESEDVIPRIVDLLTDRDEEIRKRAIHALGDVLVHGAIARRDEIIVPSLIKSLHDESSDVAAVAAYALSQFCERAASAVPDLMAIANDDSSPNCAVAAYSLLSIAPHVAIDSRLMQMLRHDNDQVRYLAAETYSHSALIVDRIQPAVPSLIVMLNDENPESRTAAARALSRMPASRAVVDALAKALAAEEDDDVQTTISRALFDGVGGSSNVSLSDRIGRHIDDTASR